MVLILNFCHMSFHYSLTSKSLIVCRPGFEGCGLPWRESSPRLLLLLPATVVPYGHEMVLEVGEVRAEVVACGPHPQLLGRGVDVALGGRGHDDAGVPGPRVSGNHNGGEGGGEKRRGGERGKQPVNGADADWNLSLRALLVSGLLRRLFCRYTFVNDGN